MSALPGDSAPNAFVFPPFMPSAPRSAPSAPAEPAPDELTMEVPLPAHDPGDPDGDLPRHGFDAEEAGSQQWEAAAPPAAEDFPWLEMPAEGPRVHAAEPTAADDEMAGWAGWDAGDAQPAGEGTQDTAAPDEAMPWAEAEEPAPWTEPAAAEEPAPWTVPEEPAPWTAPPATDDPAPWTETTVADEAPWAETPAPEEAAPWAEKPAPHDVAPWAETPSADDAGPWGDSAPEAEASAEPSWPPFIAEAEVAPPAQALFAHGAPVVEETAPAESPSAPEAAYVPATQTVPASNAQAYGEVADRLESIARALRDDPGSFLAGGSGDALGLLVTGFVLGYGHGRREGGA
jgi:hypothetical protein